ncbi:uncharacterized protein LAESUDRAFT_249127 [Laetiporus sulphureus 93-53]|uniref:Uncharacterized protein n=1 Tax=Laetiporus sulphureus 93-53 TaxID=1314785 RepID=A0A165DIP8_9APHY|nr:uncharacterized protein LAESUDRAFT_249127 [Laetiporus sulphureus 93-53]KZT04969.1 hypothetical protein LAESUDRAFT_249127 [Laetiporus sulphureus 93-53]
MIIAELMLGLKALGTGYLCSLLLYTRTCARRPMACSHTRMQLLVTASEVFSLPVLASLLGGVDSESNRAKGYTLQAIQNEGETHGRMLVASSSSSTTSSRVESARDMINSWRGPRRRVPFPFAQHCAR